MASEEEACVKVHFSQIRVLRLQYANDELSRGEPSLQLPGYM